MHPAVRPPVLHMDVVWLERKRLILRFVVDLEFIASRKGQREPLWRLDLLRDDISIEDDVQAEPFPVLRLPVLVDQDSVRIQKLPVAVDRYGPGLAERKMDAVAANANLKQRVANEPFNWQVSRDSIHT